MKRVQKLFVAFVIVCAMMVGFNMTSIDIGTHMKVNAASKIKLNKKSVTLDQSKTVKLKLKNVKAKKVKWSSSNKAVATVNKSGVVTAHQKGVATITAKYKKKKYKCKVTVNGMNVIQRSLVLRVGYGYAVYVNEAFTINVKWTSSNNAVATVNSNGYISPCSVGTTVITGKKGNTIYTCNLKVVPAFSEDDFVFDEPDEDGFTNYIDFETVNNRWYYYWSDASVREKCNRGINVGSTFKDFVFAYGSCETEEVPTYDKYKEYFSNAAYPRNKVILEYYNHDTQKTYYKSFYFDRNGTVVLIVWHR